jgi:hypothetical protein
MSRSSKPRIAVFAVVAMTSAHMCVHAAAPEQVADQQRRAVVKSGLDFRIVANERDDQEAIKAALKYFADAGSDPARKAHLEERRKHGEPPPAPMPAEGRPFPTPLGQFTYSWARLSPDIVSQWERTERDESKGTSLATRVEAARRRGDAVVIPPGVLVYGRERAGKEAPEYFLLLRDPEKGKAIRGEHLERATAASDHRGHWEISVRLTEEGGRLLKELTFKNQPAEVDVVRSRQLALVVNGEVMATPAIRSAIAHRDAMISGNFSKADAEAIVALLRGGLAKP